MDKKQIDGLRSHYDTGDMTKSIERAHPDDHTIGPDEVMVSTSIRLPRSLMQRVRERGCRGRCADHDLVDRSEVGEDDAVVPVADLPRPIDERSHPAD